MSLGGIILALVATSTTGAKLVGDRSLGPGLDSP